MGVERKGRGEGGREGGGVSNVGVGMETDQ